MAKVAITCETCEVCPATWQFWRPARTVRFRWSVCDRCLPGAITAMIGEDKREASFRFRAV